MGLIKVLLAPWRAARAQEEFQQNLVDLLREMLAVTRAQSETTAAMQGAIQTIGQLYIGPEGAPERWVRNEEDEMMAELLLRLQAEHDEPKGH